MTESMKLFEPGQIGRLQLKNRIVMPAMGTHWSTDGFATQRHVDYYVERARGGVSLVTTEGCSVQYPIGKGWQQMSVDDDKFIPGLSKLVEAIKKNGAKAAIQIHHAGAVAPSSLTGGLTPSGPSAVQRSGGPSSVDEACRALSKDEIKVIRDCYIEAAVRSWKAGFDAVEIHAAHNYLLAQFHSPVWNERSDEYGGSVTNRARLTLEIVGGIKDRIPEFSLICRLNGCEYGTEENFKTRGLTLDDSIEIARLVEAGGADAVHISAWGWGKESLKVAPAHPGDLVPLAEAVKKAVHIPVIAVGRLTPEVGEEALRSSKADFIAVGRALLADPDFANKAQAGELENITPCIGCWECLGRPRANICTVNARNGFEGLFPPPLAKAARSKKVFVIGGGPGGMEAARVSAQRGHDVTLLEKNGDLGGQLLVGDKPAAKKNLGLLKPYLVAQLRKSGVAVKLSCKATPEMILRSKPDAVIIATGGKPVLPDIKGLEKAHTVGAVDFLAGDMKTGSKILIIGGELVGCELADLLSEQQGRDITVLRRGKEFMTATRVVGMRFALLSRLAERGVKLMPGVTYKEATAEGLLVSNKNGEDQFLPADIIIIAAGSVQDAALVSVLRGIIPEVYIIGDASQPRQILQAIHEGFRTAYPL